MKLSFVSMKKLGFIDGRISKPTDRLSPKYEAWSTVNGLVLSWIINSIIPEIGCTVMRVGSPVDAWQGLEERYIRFICSD